MPLHKYFPLDRLSLLSDRLVRFTPPGAFNDPFEMAPVISRVCDDQELLSGLVEAAHRDIVKLPLNPMQKAFMLGFLKKHIHAVMPSARLGERAFCKLVSKQSMPAAFNNAIGILCLSEVDDNLLMWGHYTASHTGFLVEFDESHPFFNQRQSDSDDFRHVRKVLYSGKRPIGKIDDLSFEWFLTKAEEWSYEKEWRMLMPLSAANKVIDSAPHDVHLFEVPREAIRRIVLGHKMPPEKVKWAMETVRTELDPKTVRVQVAAPSSERYAIEFLDLEKEKDFDLAGRQRQDAFSQLTAARLLAEQTGRKLEEEIRRAFGID